MIVQPFLVIKKRLNSLAAQDASTRKLSNTELSTHCYSSLKRVSGEREVCDILYELYVSEGRYDSFLSFDLM